MLILACEIRRMIQQNKGVKFVCKSMPCNFRDYADHIGFFRHAGFIRGKQPGVASGSSNYVPITVIDVDKLKVSSGDRPYGEIAEQMSSDMTRILTQSDSGVAFQTISYAFREMLRNAVEHSLSNKVVVFGQFWPAKNRAEIALYDEGVGIREALTMSGDIKANSDEEAIKLALKPGISGVSANEASSQHKDYQNSGFGLYVTSRLCAQHGYFRVISGNSGMNRNKFGDTFYSWPFSGTCVQANIDVSNINDAKALIDQIVLEGEREAKSEGRDRRASGSSKSVSAA